MKKTLTIIIKLITGNPFFTVLTLIYFVLAYLTINETNRTHKSILIYPFVMILILIIIDLTKSRFKNIDFKLIIKRLISIPFLFFGTSWLLIFGVTNYREGQKYLGIIIGLIFIIISAILNMKKSIKMQK